MDMEFLASVREDAKSKEAVTTAITLRAALQSMGTSLRDFADAIDLSRSVVSDLNSGRIETATIPRRFALRGASYLNSAVDWFQSVLSESCETAPTPAFKAKSMPSLGRKRTWQEAIRDSDMDDDRKAFWLSDED
jgi:transcriptional regulator with XRE-family HTH domain